MISSANKSWSLRIRNFLLYSISFCFYVIVIRNPVFLAGILAAVLVNWAAGFRVKNSKVLLRAVITLDVAGWFYLCYAAEIAGMVSQTFDLVLPAFLSKSLVFPGISLLLLNAVGYVLMCARKDNAQEKNPLVFLLYLFFAPKAFIGPIMDFSDFRKELGAFPEDYKQCVLDGVYRIAWGICEKVLLADAFREIADPVYGLINGGHNLIAVPALLVWLGAIAFALQLYFELDACCNLAVGAGKLFGFSLPENFRDVFRASGFADFWSRWHITLTDWFRNNMYLPQRGRNKSDRNLMAKALLVTFCAAAVWHDLRTGIILAALVQAAAVFLESYVEISETEQSPVLKKTVLWFVLLLCAAVFPCANAYQVRELLGSMFGLYHNGFYSPYVLAFVKEYFFAWLLAAGICIPYSKDYFVKLSHNTAAAVLLSAGLGILLFAAIAVGINNGISSFLIFKF